MSEVLTFNNWLSGPPEDFVTINPKRTRKELSLDVRRVYKHFSEVSGARILITTESNYSFLCLFMGIVLSGNVPVLIPQNAILEKERHALAELCVREEDLREILTDSSSETPTQSDFRNSIVELFTSGSSGAPKKITKTIGQLDLEAAQTTRLLPKSEVQAVASTADSEHQYGLTFNIWLAMSHGLAIYDKRIKVPEDCSKIKVNSFFYFHSLISFESGSGPSSTPCKKSGFSRRSSHAKGRLPSEDLARMRDYGNLWKYRGRRHCLSIYSRWKTEFFVDSFLGSLYRWDPFGFNRSCLAFSYS